MRRVSRSEILHMSRSGFRLTVYSTIAIGYRHECLGPINLFNRKRKQLKNEQDEFSQNLSVAVVRLPKQL